MDKCLIEFTKTFQNLQFLPQTYQSHNEKFTKTLSKKKKYYICQRKQNTHERQSNQDS